MNRPLFGRIAPFLFGFYALSLLSFAAYAIITFSASTFLPGMRWEYALKHGFVLFVDYLIPVHAAAVAVAASLAGLGGKPRAPGAPADPFNRIVSSAIVAFLLLTACYAVLYEGVYTGARRRLSDMQYQSRLAREFERQANAAVKAGDYRTALDAVDRYLAIDTSNKQVAEQRLEIAARAARQTPPAPAPVVAGLDATVSAADAQALVVKAQFYYDRQDWFSAHYYAQQAVGLDARRTDALRLAAQAWERIGGLADAAKDAQTAQLFQQKKDAYALLVGGDPIAAYYRFVDLAAHNPKDEDIARSLAEASAAVQSTSFFLDQAKTYETLPGTQGILFLNDGAAEAVYIDKMVELPGGEAYFYDIEAIRYAPSGAVAWHFSAPYGRREGSAILMRCIDRTDAKVQFLPLYRQGTRPTADRTLLPLRPTLEEMRALATSRDTLAMLSIGELWRLRADLGTFGMSRQALNVDMVMKMVMPFVFLVVSLLSMALGWAFRVRAAGRLGGGSVLLVPLVPVVLTVLSLLYVHAHRVIAGFSVLAFGLPVALAILGAMQLILLAAALVLLAGQSTQ